MREDGGLFTMRGPRELEGQDRGAGARPTTRASRSTSSTRGSRARRCSRRSTSSRTPTSRRWATTRRSTSTRLSGDEPRVRRSRLLLRRPRVPAGGTGEGPAVEGLRESALRADRLDEERSERASRATRIRSRAAPTRSRRCCELEEHDSGTDSAGERSAGSGHAASNGAAGRRRFRVPRGLLRRHDVDSRRRTRKAGSCPSRRAAGGFPR